MRRPAAQRSIDGVENAIAPAVNEDRKESAGLDERLNGMERAFGVHESRAATVAAAGVEHQPAPELGRQSVAVLDEDVPFGDPLRFRVTMLRCSDTGSRHAGQISVQCIASQSIYALWTMSQVVSLPRFVPTNCHYDFLA
jgi:hypothetical protein